MFVKEHLYDYHIKLVCVLLILASTITKLLKLQTYCHFKNLILKQKSRFCLNKFCEIRPWFLYLILFVKIWLFSVITLNKKQKLPCVLQNSIYIFILFCCTFSLQFSPSVCLKKDSIKIPRSTYLTSLQLN